MSTTVQIPKLLDLLTRYVFIYIFFKYSLYVTIFYSRESLHKYFLLILNPPTFTRNF